MNEQERKKRELERLKELVSKKQKELDEAVIEPTEPIPDNIPIEPHDMDYQQPPIYPQHPRQKPSFPFNLNLRPKPTQQPQYQQPQKYPSDKITKAQAAFEVAGQLDSKRTMAMAGIIEAIVVLAVTMFNTYYGFAGATAFCFYWMFELWRMLRKRQYLRMNYGV